MTKVAFIGAGSLGFTRDLVRDILTFPLLRDAEQALMDIDAERLEFAHKSVGRIIEMGHYPAMVTATLDRAEALRDSDVVLVTILAGSTEVWRYDIEIPQEYGVDINIGDTRGPSGIFRALRTIPVMKDIARDIEVLSAFIRIYLWLVFFSVPCELLLGQNRTKRTVIITLVAFPGWIYADLLTFHHE